MSYTLTWAYLLKLTSDAKYKRVIWVYDNLNLHQAVRHEREGTLFRGRVSHFSHRYYHTQYRYTLIYAQCYCQAYQELA